MDGAAETQENWPFDLSDIAIADSLSIDQALHEE